MKYLMKLCNYLQEMHQTIEGNKKLIKKSQEKNLTPEQLRRARSKLESKINALEMTNNVLERIRENPEYSRAVIQLTKIIQQNKTIKNKTVSELIILMKNNR